MYINGLPSKKLTNEELVDEIESQVREKLIHHHLIQLLQEANMDKISSIRGMPDVFESDTNYLAELNEVLSKYSFLIILMR